MTFGNYANRQLFFEPLTNQWSKVGDYKVSYGGTLKNLKINTIEKTPVAN